VGNLNEIIVMWAVFISGTKEKRGQKQIKGDRGESEGEEPIVLVYLRGLRCGGGGCERGQNKQKKHRGG